MKPLSIFFCFSFLLLYGCGNDSDKSKTAGKEDQKMVSPESRKMDPLILKGMYVYSGNAAEFYDCTSHKTYLISENGENESIKEAYEKMPSKKPDEKVYVELEGFVSAQTKATGKDMDTVLVVTRFFKLDRARKCE